MRRLSLLFCGLATLAAPPLLADNLIVVDEPNDPNSGAYTLDQQAFTLVIKAPGTFKVHATDAGGLGRIASITVDAGVTGTVNLYVQDPTNPDTVPGADHVGYINLCPNWPKETVTGNLAHLYVSTYLG